MLTDPPCINPLLGCSNGFFSGNSTYRPTRWSGYDTTSPSGLGGLEGLGSLGGGSSQSLSLPRGPGGDLRQYLPSYASGTSLLRSAKEYAALYTLRARNTGSSLLKGVKVLHGPLPFNLTFDPSRSSRSCSLVSKTVECTTDLAPGQEETFSIAYKTTSSFSCAFARFLEKAKSTVQSITSQTANPVVVTVSCRTESRSLGSGTSGANGAGGYGLGSGTHSDGMTTSGSTLNQYGNGTHINGTISDTTTGYKPYILPRTGAADTLFQGSLFDTSHLTQRTMSTTSNDGLLPHGSLLAIILLCCLSFIILYRTMRFVR